MGDETMPIHYRNSHQQGVSTADERRKGEMIRMIWEL